MQRILIPGGAGLIGSHIAAALVDAGRQVTVIDGFMPRTGGSLPNLKAVFDRIRFIGGRVEDVEHLPELVAGSDAVIDCMGWTCHRAGMDDPEYDRALNQHSHLTLLRTLRAGVNPRFIYLGSRGQYGRPRVDRITEDCAQEPVDIQGIHKTAAEHYYRVFAGRYGLDVASLRFAACVGRGQVTEGPDIGLFGGFTRELLRDGTVSVYGSGRTRLVTDARDVAAMVCALLEADWRGFQAFHLPGQLTAIDAGARMLQQLAGRGAVEVRPMPSEVAHIDIGEAQADCSRLEALIGPVTLRPLEETFATLVEYFRGELR
jgi:UDP-glucose 4-epimerase